MNEEIFGLRFTNASWRTPRSGHYGCQLGRTSKWQIANLKAPILKSPIETFLAAAVSFPWAPQADLLRQAARRNHKQTKLTI